MATTTIEATNLASATKPAYAELLDAYHEAHVQTLRQAAGSLPLRPGDHVLDVCCGDGFYSRLLAERVGARGVVIGIDRSLALLNEARGRRDNEGVQFQEGDAHQLPFANDHFDMVWCAQSLISLRAAAAALREMQRVLKPGHCAAVLENDELHHALLPWPPQLELALYRAARAARREQLRSPDKLSIGRFVRRLVREAGFAKIIRRTFVTDHQPPLSLASRRFFDAYLASLRRRLRDQLSQHDRALFDRLTQCSSPDYLPQQPDFEATCIDVLTLGEKP